MKRLLAIIIGFLIPAAVSAETITLDLNAALDYGLKRNLSLQQYEKAVEIAKLKVNQALADLYMPDVAVTGTFTYLDPQTVDSANTAVQVAWQDNYAAALKITKALFAGFALSTSYELNKWQYELAVKQLEDEKRQIRYDITKDFYNLFLLAENVVLMEDYEKQLQKTLDSTRLNYGAGLVSDYDLIQVQVELMNLRPSILKMKNAYETAKLAFLQSIGLDIDEDAQMTGSLWDATNLTVPTNSVESLVKAALTNDITAVGMRYSLKVYDYSLKLTQASRYPSLSAYFNYGLEYDRDTDAESGRSWGSSWTAGLTLSIPIDDWIPVSSEANAIREVIATREKTELALMQYEQSVELQVKSLLMSINESMESMAGQKATVDQGKLGLDIANKQYNAGLISSLELNNAEVNYQDARTSYLESVYNYINAVLKLDMMIACDDYCDQILSGTN